MYVSVTGVFSVLLILYFQNADNVCIKDDESKMFGGSSVICIEI